MILASVGAGTVVGVLVSAFLTGALARFAVPGPDPMPIWLTILIGFAGSLGGGGVAYAAGWRNPYGISTVGFLVAVLLVAGYRRFVQRRPLWGPGAYRYPERGIGVQGYRERLTQAGIDPDRIGAPFAGPPSAGGAAAPAHPRPPEAGMPTENPAHYLGLLQELHDAGVLSDDEYGAARLRLGPPSAGGAAAPANPRPPEAGLPTENPAHYLGLLEELHDAGVLSEDEYGAARLRLLEQLRG